MRSMHTINPNIKQQNTKFLSHCIYNKECIISFFTFTFNFDRHYENTQRVLLSCLSSTKGSKKCVPVLYTQDEHHHETQYKSVKCRRRTLSYSYLFIYYCPVLLIFTKAALCTRRPLPIERASKCNILSDKVYQCQYYHMYLNE